MFAKCVIDTQNQFAEHAGKAVKGITSLYLPAEDVLIKPDGIKASPRIKDTLQIHIMKRFFDKKNVPYLQFFKMATNEKPFFAQFYVEGVGSHQKIAADCNHYGSCLGDYESNEEYLQCPVCKVWFHNNCFFNLIMDDKINTSDILMFLTAF